MTQALLNEIVSAREILLYSSEKGILLGPGALELLRQRQNFKEIVDEFASQGKVVLDEKSLRDYLVKKESRLSSVEQTVSIERTGFMPLAKDLEPRFRMLEDLNITNQSTSTGKVEHFLEMFRDKYGFLSQVLRKRIGLQPKPLSRLERMARGNEIEAIVMVREKRLSKNGHFVLVIEDLDSEAVGLVLKDSGKLFEQARGIMLDDVLGIKGQKANNEMIIIKEIFWPDLPQRPLRFSERDLGIASISDIHVGSKLFLEKEFNHFLSWLNGNASSEKERKKIGKIKYLVIAGDNVDGIGVYPTQYDELVIKDIYGQYEALSELLEQVPEYIEVIICPGQHDAVRWADPMPAIPKEFLPRLHELKNFHFISSPGWFEVEGLKGFVFHGASLHDVNEAIPGMETSKPQETMIELLKRRDLMSSYGQKRPYVPESKNYLLVRQEPDLCFVGETHYSGFAQYRGCTIVSPGTWQEQTSFQAKINVIPNPGICPVVEMKSHAITENRFYKRQLEGEIE